MRVNGSARTTIAPDLLARFAVDGKPCAIDVKVETAHFQCVRAIQIWRL